MAKPSLDVLEPMVLLGRRTQRLGQQHECLDPQRQLAASRDERDPVDPDQIAEVEVEQSRHPVGAEVVDARLELDPPGTVDQVQERHFALAAPRRQAAGDAVRHGGLVAGLEVAVGIADRRDRLDASELVWKRVHPCRPQLVELAPAGGEDVCGFLAQGGPQSLGSRP